MIISSLLPNRVFPPSESSLIYLGGGDFLSCEVSIPLNWKEEDPTVILVHGMGGSHLSGYMVRMAYKIYLRGKKVVRVNLRGCGSGMGLSKLPYSAGTSDDVLRVLQVFKKKSPKSEITVIGFSLGGNIILKLAGELGEKAEEFVKTFIAVCPPLDLANTVKMIEKRQFYHAYYLKKILKQASHLLFQKIRTLYEFDDLITAPLWGYKNADEYYQSCSSQKFISGICQSTYLLLAKDDPFIDFQKLEEISLPSFVNVWMTEKGSHMGFLGKTTKEHSPYFMDDLLLGWIEK
ncbi:MAG: alpha/beta fold hydrolase [Verrucomicrobia bacterium]|nr:alpha/beta fold hydrolase [Verrucomicrobiota bacterium]